jgi:hypothetical protein
MFLHIALNITFQDGFDYYPLRTSYCSTLPNICNFPPIVYTKLAKVRKFSFIKNLVIIEKLITLDR